MNPRVLIVDDDAGTRRLLSYVLSKKNLDVVEAANGEEGLFYVLNENPSLVVLDWRMPQLNGQEMIILTDRILSQMKPKESEEPRNKMKLILYTSVRSEDLFLPKMRSFDLIAYIHKGWNLDFQQRKFHHILESLKTRGGAAA